ncbi:hypothetical protein A2G06_16765 (plasmid) [Geobacter anodireducens]|nr:hypothetical protein A2G06_16765 [Geobacter anodireducens]
MPLNTISPFRNESEVIQINGLTVENRLDRVSIYGSIDLTLDKIGLKKARKLLEVVMATVDVLEAEDLPEKVITDMPETVKNPFD